MNAEFNVMIGTQYGERKVNIHPYVPDIHDGNSSPRVVVIVSHAEQASFSGSRDEGVIEAPHRILSETLILKRSEARAIASAIMGAAAEA